MTPVAKKDLNIIPGFHGIRESLLQGHFQVRELWLAEGKKSRRTKEILDLAEARSIPVRLVTSLELETHFGDLRHQGMVALAAPFSYSSLAEIVKRSAAACDRRLVLAADHITDEGNLGALIRTGGFFGADGLIIPKDRSALVSPRVMKRSSGGAGFLPVCKVVNLGRALDSLSGEGFWVIGAAGESPQSVYRFDWNRPLVLVLGNEERGLSPAVRKRCHEVVSIPQRGVMESLNISVAAGVILGEIRRQQGCD